MSSAVIIVTVVRIPLIVVSHSVQDSRTLWASIEILTACVVANAPILNNFYYEWKNRRHNGRDAGVMDEEDRDDELRSGYSSKSKVPNVLMKRPPTRDAMKGMGKGYPRHTSEESFSPPAGGPGPFVIEVCVPLQIILPDPQLLPLRLHFFTLSAPLSTNTPLYPTGNYLCDTKYLPCLLR